jgi:hypothetical protein
MKVTELQELSSDVLLQLRVAGEVLRVGQVCDGLMYLRETRSLPACDAELLITINGRQEVHPIFLPHGIDAQSEIVEFF